MAEEHESFIRYLEAKKQLDDRSLNAAVWQMFLNSLPPLTPLSPLRVVEVGAGIGTMIQRLIERRVLSNAAYTALDSQASFLEVARRRLSSWAQKQNIAVHEQDSQLHLQSENLDLFIDFVARDVREWLLSNPPTGTVDLILAHAFLDLVSLEEVLPPLFACLKPDGVFYFTLTFDGLTVFEPLIDPQMDALIVSLYHQSMDMREQNGSSSGASCSGRRLFGAIARAGGDVLEAGASDWVIFPRRGGYPAGEAVVLNTIIGMVEETLQGHPALDGRSFQKWLAARRQQIAQARLLLIAHQIDLVGRKGNSTNGG